MLNKAKEVFIRTPHSAELFQKKLESIKEKCKDKDDIIKIVNKILKNTDFRTALNHNSESSQLNNHQSTI